MKDICVILLSFCALILLPATVTSQVKDTIRPRLDTLIRLKTQDRLSTMRARNNLIAPLMSYNVNDGFQLGGVFTNYLSNRSGFKYTVAPMWGFGSKRIVGSSSFSYNVVKDSDALYDRLRFGLDIRHYSFDKNLTYDTRDQFYKVAPEIAFYKYVDKDESTTKHRISYRMINIWQRYTQGIDMTAGTFDRLNKYYYVNELRYERSNDHEYKPSNSVLFIHQGNDLIKLFGMYEQFYRLSSHSKVRLKISGSYVNSTSPDPENARIGVIANGTTSFHHSQREYTHDQNFIGRSSATGFWSRQIYDKDAALRTHVPVFDDFGKWIIGVGADIELPAPIPPKIKPYMDIAIYNSGRDDKITTAWVGGFAISLLGENLQIFFPILYSSKIKERYELADIGNKISFSLKLKNLDRVVDKQFN